MKLFIQIIIFIIGVVIPNIIFPQNNKIEILKNDEGYALLNNGNPYYIKGAGAKSNFQVAANSGANSIRIWSTNNKQYLDSIYKYGLTVTLGLWVAQERNGFNYDDEYAVAGQIERLKKEILKLKDHPALIIWGIGNEVDLKYSNFKVWETIEELASFIKKLIHIIQQ